MGRIIRASVVFVVVAWLVAALDGVKAFNVDFTVLWAAGRHAFGAAYDPEFITAAQAQFGYPGIRPFAYPPTLLLMLLPFGALPFALAYPAWCGFSAAAFVAAWENLNRQWAPLLLINPIVGLALLTGQTTLFVGACMVGLTMMSRPVLAGILFGTALCIKPQAVILLPLGLLLIRRFDVLLPTILTGAAWTAASAAVFGPHIWLDWLNALPGFLKYTHALHLTGISPAWITTGPLSPVFQAIGVLAGLLVVAVSFRSEEVAHRLVGIVGGSILCSPYAMRYELAAVAPAALWFLGTRSWRMVPGLGLLVFGHVASPLTAAGFTLAACYPWRLPGLRPTEGAAPSPENSP